MLEVLFFETNDKKNIFLFLLVCLFLSFFLYMSVWVVCGAVWLSCMYWRLLFGLFCFVCFWIRQICEFYFTQNKNGIIMLLPCRHHRIDLKLSQHCNMSISSDAHYRLYSWQSHFLYSAILSKQTIQTVSVCDLL